MLMATQSQRRPASVSSEEECDSSMGPASWADTAIEIRPHLLATRAGCLKLRSRDLTSMPEKKKSVSFPLDTIFMAAVKEHRHAEVNTIVNLLVPESITSQTLRQPSVQASAVIRRDVTIRLEPLNIHQTSARGHNALMLCAREGHFESVRLLVVAGADVRYQAPGGWSVFHSTTVSGRPDMMRWLLANCGLSFDEMFAMLSAVQQELFYVLGQAKMAETKKLVDASLRYLSQQLKPSGAQ